MNKRDYFLLLFFTACLGYAQQSETLQNSEQQSTNKVLSVLDLDEMFVFPGCENLNFKDAIDCFQYKLVEHIKKHFKYPSKALKQGVQGKTNVFFAIEKDGSISILKVNGHELLTPETIRIIKKLPKMKPGKVDGKSIRCTFTIPVNFKIDN
jgi:bla regulator protein blaR1